METDRQTYQQKIEKQISQWGTELGALTAKVEKTGAEAKVELQKQVDELHALQKEAKKHLDDFVSTSAEKWKDTKKDLESTWTKLSTAVESAWQRVTK
jgi:uncharacterized membrane-anchored protein YhcB (DUF1043 family)